MQRHVNHNGNATRQPADGCIGPMQPGESFADTMQPIHPSHVRVAPELPPLHAAMCFIPTRCKTPTTHCTITPTHCGDIVIRHKGKDECKMQRSRMWQTPHSRLKEQHGASACEAPHVLIQMIHTPCLLPAVCPINATDGGCICERALFRYQHTDTSCTAKSGPPTPSHEHLRWAM